MTSTDKYTPAGELISLRNKRAIVSGGSMGIGLAICYRLAEAGAAVVIADINEIEAEKACRKLGENGYQVTAVRCDVSREDDVVNMVNISANKMGGIDILVNNAGIFPRMPLAQTSYDDFEQVIAVNLRGTFLCSREVSKHMIEQKQGGCIINIASIDSVHPSAEGLSAYDASKGGVLTLTKSLALELGQYNIRVNAIAPGVILTESVVSQMRKSPTEHGKAQLKALLSRTALGRMGKADDIGRVALFLASDLASYLTGSLIVADGGYLIS
jgi:2-deoxy-D-gluconate 3-dehydrogenase